MAGLRGSQHANRSTAFPVDKAIRASAVLYPGEVERKQFEELVHLMGVSGAEVIREGIREVFRRETKRKEHAEQRAARKNARKGQDTEELPKAG
jgi:hypothetical protein